MTGLLAGAPTQQHLERLYHELARLGAPAVGRRSAWPYHPGSTEELLALAGEMLRYDPRLLTILLQWVLEHWQDLDPQALRRSMRRMRWPQALAVVFEFARAADSNRELGLLADYVTARWPRLDPAEQFFFDAARPGSRMAARSLGRSLSPYTKWGFVGTERPIVDVGTKRAVGRYDRATRLRILDRLLDERQVISLADYLEAVDNAVSRQQARNDLAGHPELTVEGRGRGAHWRRRRRARSSND